MKKSTTKIAPATVTFVTNGGMSTINTNKEPDGSFDEKNVALSWQEDGQNISVCSDTREKWTHKLDFIMSSVGFAVGLGNVWRFPYLCYANGGGAFFIPYIISLLLGGMPIFMLEVGLGQFMAKGGFECWNICPMFKGIGLATTVIVFLMNIYYIMILAWDVNYMMYAFTWVLPWSHCNNSWNTPNCQVSAVHGSALDDNTTGSTMSNFSSMSNFTPVDPVLEFWKLKLLQISPSIDEPNGVVWQLALSLFAVWVLVYFCVWKGVKWTGKVVYFTATFPYVILTILLFRGLTLEGAGNGIAYYLKPDFSKLANSRVWMDAGTQVFFSYAIALGAMTALGSYNKFDNNFFRDCLIIACVNSGTSIYAGFVVFSVLGFMSHQQQLPIDQVADRGPGLAFIAYPKAVTEMPAAPVWAILFFLMIIMIGLDSQFVAVESFMTVIKDRFPILRKPYYQEGSIGVYCLVSYLLGLTMVTRGGIYVFQIFDAYAASGMSLLWVCLAECVVVAWFYGRERFASNIKYMIGYRIFPLVPWCWAVLSPLICLAMLLFMWFNFSPLKYDSYVLPPWAQTLGLLMAVSSMICIPGYMVYLLFMTPGTLAERWQDMITPILGRHQIQACGNDVPLRYKLRRSSGFLLVEKPYQSLRQLENNSYSNVADYNSSHARSISADYNLNSAKENGHSQVENVV